MKAVPEGYHSVTPYAAVEGATSLREPMLEFYGDRMSGVTDLTVSPV